MQIVKDGEFYKLARITGPTHNILSLRYGDESVDPIVEVLDPNKKGRLVAESVKDQVLLGVSEANRFLGTDYQVHVIQFSQSDSGPSEIYRELARRLTERMNEMSKSQV